MLYSAKKLVTAPAAEPLSLIKAKEFLRVTHNAHDSLINDLIKSVRISAENFVDMAFAEQVWKVFFKEWPGTDDYFILPHRPLVDVAHIKYTDTDGTVTTLAETEYIVDYNSEYGRIFLGVEKYWPSDELYPVNPIEIQFICGFTGAQSPPDILPEDLITMMKIGLERIYDRPDESYDKLLINVWESIGGDYNKGMGI